MTNLLNKNAYETLSNFLKEHEGRKMRVGIHAFNVCCVIEFNEWRVFDDGIEIFISDDQNNVSVYDGDKSEITGFTADSRSMNIFPERGDFELQTAHAGICFELLWSAVKAGLFSFMKFAFYREFII